jgi:GNAT superfamily N-acetyltransferase
VDPAARLVAHRVIETLPDGNLRVRGDFAFTAEAPVEPRRIVGRLTSVDRAGRTVHLEGPIGRLLALGLPRLERARPDLLAVLRRSVIGGVQLADGLWTAGPVRRARRRLGVRRVVSPVTEADASVVGAHLRRSGKDPAAIGMSPADCWIAARPGPAPAPVVGSIRICADPEIRQNAWLLDLYVEHRWRGLGFGRSLLSAGLTAALSGGARRVSIRAIDDDRRAHALLSGFGFKPADGDRTVQVLVLS